MTSTSPSESEADKIEVVGILIDDTVSYTRKWKLGSSLGTIILQYSDILSEKYNKLLSPDTKIELDDIEFLGKFYAIVHLHLLQCPYKYRNVDNLWFSKASHWHGGVQAHQENCAAFQLAEEGPQDFWLGQQ